MVNLGQTSHPEKVDNHACNLERAHHLGLATLALFLFE
nr:MAG TPA: hypothetical protein [Caudoviricetes sp.]